MGRQMAKSIGQLTQLSRFEGCSPYWDIPSTGASLKACARWGAHAFTMLCMPRIFERQITM